MSKEKKGFDSLNRDDLKDVTGGVPYERPQIIDLIEAIYTCNNGISCATGTDTNCGVGFTCRAGKQEF